MDIQPSIVAILTRETSARTYAGTGFLAGNGIIITCAHVLDAAREKDQMVRVQFQSHEPVQAKIIAFSAKSEFDIAILQPAEIPADVPPLPLTFARASIGHNFKAYGYPEISMDVPRLAGIGSILDMIQHINEDHLLQLNSEQVSKGYSGSPVWDEALNAVVGMVNSGITLNIGLAHHGTTFAVPSETLQKIYPALELIELVEPIERGSGDPRLTHPDVGRGSPDPRLSSALFSVVAPPTNFTGRSDEIADLLAHFNNGICISGDGGVGKSALACVLVEKLADQYPDARIQLDLRGTPRNGQAPLTPVDALRRLLQPFHPTAQLPDDLPNLQTLFTDTLRGKRVLFLLDNADSTAQVRPLLPPAPSAVIITSRPRIILTNVGLHPKEIGKLLPEDARALLRKIAPSLTSVDDASVDTLANQCGTLPQALNVVAALLESRPDWTPAHLIERLADERTRLSMLKMDDDPDLDVEASLSLSYNELDEETQRRFRTLGIFSAPFNLPALAALWELPPAACDQAIGVFMRLSLLKTRPADPMPYSLNELTRIYAEDRLRENAEAWATSVQRHADYFLAQGQAADELYRQGHEHALEGLRQFDMIWPHLQVAYQRSLQNTGSELADRWLNNFSSRVVYTLNLRITPRQKIPLLQSALAAARGLQDQSSESIHNINLGNAYHDLGETHRAIEYYEQSLAIARKIGDREAEGNALGNLGNAFGSLGDTRHAIEYYEQSLAIAHEIGHRRVEGNAIGNLGLAYGTLGETRRSIEYYEQSLAIAREIGDRQAVGNALGNLGNAFADLGETPRAIEYYEQSLAITREIGNRKGESLVLSNLGNAAYADLGEMSRAIAYYEQSLAILREIGNRNGEGIVLAKLGIVYGNLGEISRAIEYYEQSLVIAREIGDKKGEGSTLSDLGLAYSYLGETHRSIEYYEQSLKVAREIADQRVEGNALGNLGLAYTTLGETRRAIAYYEQSLKVARELGDRRVEGNVLGNLGLVYADLGETRRAIEYYEQSLVIAREIGDRQSEGNMFSKLGLVYASLGKADKALAYYEQLQTIAREIGDKLGEANVYWQMGLVFEAQGQFLRAAELMQMCIDYYAAIGNPNAAAWAQQVEEVRKKGKERRK